MRSGTNLFLFAGPTLHLEGTSIAAAAERAFTLRPPVTRGDIWRITKRSRPGIMVIVDGLFFRELAVGHMELRMALDQGWKVWGLSSLGAIRAFEMRALGMHGFGSVYKMFEEACERGQDFQDDEVALLHEGAPLYRPLSEPLVHLRQAISAVTVEGVVDEGQGSEILQRLKQLWFGERTLQRLDLEISRVLAGSRLSAARASLTPFDRFRIKSLDLMQFLSEQPWSVRG